MPTTPLAPRSRRAPSWRARALVPVVAAGSLVFSILGTSCTQPPFRTVFRDDFTGAELDARWFTYRGSPSTDPDATWTAERVRLEDGVVVLDGVPTPGRPGHWDIGGMANGANPLTYGRWTIRFRVSTSSVLSWHLLLWPQDETWPPEIDIAEGWDEERATAQGFVHYLDSNGQYQRPYNRVDADFTRWQTVVLTWTPDRLSWSLNGQEWASVTGEAVPRVPMRLSMQVESQSCDRNADPCTEDAATPNPRLEVDDVLVEAYVPPAPAPTTTTTPAP